MKSHKHSAIPFNPFYRNPMHPNFNRRAHHHDYTRPARYLITFLKADATPILSRIEGHPPYCSYESAVTILSPVGCVIPDAVARWNEKFPQIYLHAIAIMPDHIHVCVDVTSHLPNGLSRAIGSLKGSISSAYHQSIPEEVRPAEMQTLFAKGFNDRIAYDKEQWERQIHYTFDNPRRYMIKRDMPEYMTTRWIITIGNEQYVAKGNIFLLHQPHILQVKFSKKFQPKEADDWRTWNRTLIQNGSIPISPFIHPEERSMRDYAVDNDLAYVRICENGFAERANAYGKEFHLMSEGRLLLIAPMEHQTRKREMKYQYAQVLNGMAMRISSCINSGMSWYFEQLRVF